MYGMGPGIASMEIKYIHGGEVVDELDHVNKEGNDVAEEMYAPFVIDRGIVGCTFCVEGGLN